MQKQIANGVWPLAIILSFERILLGLFSLKFFFDLLNIYRLTHRLKAQDLHTGFSAGRFSFILAAFSFQSGN